ncbi:hypothetical protein NDU88_000197 [Pleurodeles waltl]|uniref:Uncharacterized protein n=1 Tax=Pleurodeles waltl TaxID=8319 RepID=A0AAV7VXP5_PLEWA|nr:hypothetical protein NDU88_000197 [Pleurodeles waltl]
METKGGVTRSRDSKDFFEEKQLVTLRPNTRWRAIAEHANLLRLMPRTDVHWRPCLPPHLDGASGLFFPASRVFHSALLSAVASLRRSSRQLPPYTKQGPLKSPHICGKYLAPKSAEYATRAL